MKKVPKSEKLQKTIIELKILGKERKLWKAVAESLERKRKGVNISKISRSIRDDELAVVPGKVLAFGEIDKPITIIAYQYSRRAMEKIVRSGGKCLNFSDINEELKKSSMRIFE